MSKASHQNYTSAAFSGAVSFLLFLGSGHGCGISRIVTKHLIKIETANRAGCAILSRQYLMRIRLILVLVRPTNQGHLETASQGRCCCFCLMYTASPNRGALLTTFFESRLITKHLTLQLTCISNTKRCLKAAVSRRQANKGKLTPRTTSVLYLEMAAVFQTIL